MSARVPGSGADSVMGVIVTVNGPSPVNVSPVAKATGSAGSSPSDSMPRMRNRSTLPSNENTSLTTYFASITYSYGRKVGASVCESRTDARREWLEI